VSSGSPLTGNMTLTVVLTLLLPGLGASVDADLDDIVMRVRDHEDKEGLNVRGNQRISTSKLTIRAA
jgi:hypothetical protein